jgi:hypothetical protein
MERGWVSSGRSGERVEKKRKIARRRGSGSENGGRHDHVVLLPEKHSNANAPAETNGLVPADLRGEGEC